LTLANRKRETAFYPYLCPVETSGFAASPERGGEDKELPTTLRIKLDPK